MALSLFARSAGLALRGAGLRSSLLGVRVFSMSRPVSALPALTSLQTKTSWSQNGSVVPVSTTMPVSVRHASTSLDTHGATTWKYFRYVTLGMFCTIPIAVNVPNPVFDCMLSALISLHAYWGVDEIITDYVHATGLQSMVRNLWRVWVSLSFFGLLYFNYNDVGLIKAIGLLWSLN